MTDDLVSREELLAGSMNRTRRANKLREAIEARCIYMRSEARRVVAAYLLGGADEFERRFDLQYTDVIKQMVTEREGLRAVHLERYMAQWKALLPADPEVRARLIHLLKRKYAIDALGAPQTWAELLGANAAEVQAVYQKLFDRLPELPSEPEAANLALPPSPSAEDAVWELIEARLEWLSIASGETLFQAGDPGDSLYVVISGRMSILVRGEDGREHCVREVGRGEMFGEMSVLTGDPRSATLRAVRDSELVQLSRDGLFALAQRHLSVMVHLTALIARRMNQPNPLAGRSRSSTLALALLPCDGSLPLQDFGRELAAALSQIGPTIYLTRAALDEAIEPGAAQAAPQDPRSAQIAAWLSELETRYRFVVYEAAPEISEWSRRCLRQSDHILLVGRAAAAPQPSGFETALLAGETSGKPIELVLLQDADPAAGRAAAWLAPRPNLRAHHHVRPGSQADLLHLARRVSGRALGLVLSGGGARGFGHIGALRALREMGILVDEIGGTSMGSLIAAAFAMGLDDQQLQVLAQQVGSRKVLLDSTLPIFSFYATHKVTALIQKLFGRLSIEDLRLPFFCNSANLSQGCQFVHTTGPVWQAVRASMAASPIFTPFLLENDLVVDGGFLNNLPVDLMRQHSQVATVLGVDASPLSSKPRDYAFGTGISTWDAIRYQLTPAPRRKSPPTIPGIVSQIMDANGIYRRQYVKDQADLIITLPLRSWGMLDFDDWPDMIEQSYRAACEQLAAWKTNSSASEREKNL